MAHYWTKYTDPEVREHQTCGHCAHLFPYEDQDGTIRWACSQTFCKFEEVKE